MNIPEQLNDMRFNRVRFKDKKAFEKAWQDNPYTYNEISKFFPGDNYGVICGEDLRVLDDDSEDKRLVRLFVNTFGQTFKVRDHLYFKFDNKHSKKIILFGEEREHLGEIQGENTYVVGPGSTHPSGEIYELKNSLDIITISYDKFMDVFGKYINPQKTNSSEKVDYDNNVSDDPVVKQVKDNWKDGDRQNLALSLAGYLRKKKRFGIKTTIGVIQNICEECGDMDFEERKRAVVETYQKDERFIKGETGLTERNIVIDKSIKEQVFTAIISRQEDLASEIITQNVLNGNHIYTTRDDVKSEIWFYDDGIYVPNGRSRIQEIAREILGETYTPQRVNKVIAKVEADTMIDHDDFFINQCKNEIPVQNGILNIFTKEVCEFTPEKIFFNKLPITYDESKKCPSIKKFFSDVLKDSSDVEVMLELIGFCLLKEYKFEKSIMFIGDGRNGKGKTLSLIKHFLGADNCCSIPLSQINAASTSVCELHGRLANLAGDLNNTDLKDTGMFKQITGRDLITAKRKYLNDLFFENYAKIIFACNELQRFMI